MSSHNTNRHFRLRKGSHFCCHKLDWAALGWALGLRTESSSVPKAQIWEQDPVPGSLCEFTSAGALLQLVPASILNAEEGKGLCRSRSGASWARGPSRHRERGIAFHDPHLENWPDFLSCVLTIPIGRDFQPLSIYTHFFLCQHCLFT